MTSQYNTEQNTSPTKKYDAVIFDLFGTLVDNFQPDKFELFLLELADILQAPRQEFVHMWNVETWPMRSRGDFATLEETFVYVCKKLGVTAAETTIQSVVEKRLAYTQEALISRPDAVATLATLKQAGYKIGLISDCTVETPTFWEKLPLAPLVDVPIFSCVVHMKKPDPRIYRLAYEQLKVEPQRCLYVGDGGSKELTGAVAVGMDTVLIRAPYEIHDQKYRNDEESDWMGTRIGKISDILPLVDPTLIL